MTYEFIIGFLIGAFVLYMVVDIWNYKKIKKYDVFLEISSPALKIIAQRIKNYEEEEKIIKDDIKKDDYHIQSNSERLKNINYVKLVLRDIQQEISSQLWGIDINRRIV